MRNTMLPVFRNSIVLAECSKETVGVCRISKCGAVGETGRLNTHSEEFKWLNALLRKPPTHFGELIANCQIG